MGRVEAVGSHGQAAQWRTDCEAAGFLISELGSRGDQPELFPAELRATHPDGTVIRIFPGRPDGDLAYCYPPGGTDRPTGPPTLPAFMDTSQPAPDPGPEG